jgi:threonine/homoserine/homoserine lactone efflux protein
MGIDNFVTFALTAFLFIMTPGLDTIFVINKALGQGKKAGIYSALGVNAGVLVHTVLPRLAYRLLWQNRCWLLLLLNTLGLLTSFIWALINSFQK